MAATKNLIAYSAVSAQTITLASLASDTSLLAGRTAIAWDNTANLYMDLLVSGKITTGTSPTAGAIELWAVGMLDDTNWPDAFGGTDANVTVTSTSIKSGLLVPLWSVATSTTSNQAYPVRLTSLASRFGGSLPAKGQLFVVHSTVAVLNATGANQVLNLKGVYTTSGN